MLHAGSSVSAASLDAGSLCSVASSASLGLCTPLQAGGGGGIGIGEVVWWHSVRLSGIMTPIMKSSTDLLSVRIVIGRSVRGIVLVGVCDGSPRFLSPAVSVIRLAVPAARSAGLGCLGSSAAGGLMCTMIRLSLAGDTSGGAAMSASLGARGEVAKPDPVWSPAWLGTFARVCGSLVVWGTTYGWSQAAVVGPLCVGLCGLGGFVVVCLGVCGRWVGDSGTLRVSVSSNAGSRAVGISPGGAALGCVWQRGFPIPPAFDPWSTLATSHHRHPVPTDTGWHPPYAPNHKPHPLRRQECAHHPMDPRMALPRGPRHRRGPRSTTALNSKVPLTYQCNPPSLNNCQNGGGTTAANGTPTRASPYGDLPRHRTGPEPQLQDTLTPSYTGPV